MRLCKHCHHYRLHAQGHACVLHVKSEVDVVTGHPFQTGRVDCYAERSDKGRCGPDGKLYKERTPWRTTP